MKTNKIADLAVLTLLALLLVTAHPAAAQTADQTALSKAQPKVTGIEGNLEADDLIRVYVDNLDEWAKTNDPTKLVPYLNGLSIRGNYPREIHASQNHLQFHLRITPDNTGPKPIGGKLRPYNLGRTQMAFWFFLVYS